MSSDFVARQKQAKPNRSRDGFLKVSHHHMTSRAAEVKPLQTTMPQMMTKLDSIKSPRQRYNAADEEDCVEEEYRSSLPSCIEEFSCRQINGVDTSEL